MVWVAPPSSHVEQLVERRALDVGQREVARPSSVGHHTVTRANGCAVGEVEPAHPQHAVDAEHRAHAGGRGHEPEVEDPPLGARCPTPASCASIVPSRPSDWRSGSAADEPAEPLARVDEPLVAQHLERLADRDPAGAVRSGQLGLAGQQPPARELAGLDPPAQVVGDLLVADRCALVLYLSTESGAKPQAVHRQRP